MKSFRIVVFAMLALVAGLMDQAIAQTNYLASMTSVTLSSNLEFANSSYTLVANGIVDGAAALPTTGFSYVPAGSVGAVAFPPGTGTSNVTTVTITIGGTPYVIPATPFQDGATFITPVAVARGQAVSMFVPNVRNPVFNPSCLNDPNNYAEASGPCNNPVYIELVNATGGSNYYHHFGTVRYSIAKRPYYVQSVTVERTNAAAAPQGTADNEMLTVNIEVGGSFGAFPVLNSLSFNTGSTTSVADILTANVWSTNKLKYFHAPGEAPLGTFPTPSGAMNVTGLTRTLTKGNNFFWLTYDLRCDQTSVGHLLDGDLVSMVIDGSPSSPAGPSTTRLIGPSYTLPTANLIPNPGFETFSSCPSILTQTFDNSIAKATGWNYLSPPSGGTADYFNACAAGGQQADVPTSVMGFQVPHGGDGYAGLVLDGSVNNFWEYLTAPLSATLQLNTVYYLSFYVSSADFYANGNPIFKSSGLGAYFTSAPIVVTNAAKLTATPQFQYTPVIYDQQDWVHVFGTFTANGTENRITIGGFGPIIQDTVATSAYRDVFSSPGSYIFLDDFTLCRLSEVSEPCLGGPLAMQSLDLQGVSLPGANKLSWEATTDAVVDRFEIMAGPGVDQLELIDKLPAKPDALRYEFVDGHSVEGARYYRIRQFNRDGSTLWSNLLQLSSSLGGITFNNPVQGLLTLRGLEDDCGYRMLGLDGRIYLEGTTEARKIDLGNLPRGLYFLELQPKTQARFIARVRKD